jgi:putative spermidine/putrescine transport system ATP-binding protein
MSDIVVVMHQSRIAQVGSPRALYESPANLFVADFLGDSNLLPGRIVETAGAQAIVELANGQAVRVARGEVMAMTGQKAVVLVRPEDMRVGAPADGQDYVRGRIVEVSYHGDSYRLEIALGPDLLKVKVPRLSGIGLEPGQDVEVAWAPDAARLVPIDDGKGGGPSPSGG